MFVAIHFLSSFLKDIKDRTNESFGDYFPYRKKKCKLKHVRIG
jgi:hypothetical protein